VNLESCLDGSFTGREPGKRRCVGRLTASPNDGQVGVFTSTAPTPRMSTSSALSRRSNPNSTCGGALEAVLEAHRTRSKLLWSRTETPELAVAVSNAGAFGMVITARAGGADPAAVARLIERTRALTSQPFGRKVEFRRHVPS